MTSDDARLAVLLIRMADACRAAMDDPRIDAVSRWALVARYTRLVAALDRVTGAVRMAA